MSWQAVERGSIEDGLGVYWHKALFFVNNRMASDIAQKSHHYHWQIAVSQTCIQTCMHARMHAHMHLSAKIRGRLAFDEPERKNWRQKKEKKTRKEG